MRNRFGRLVTLIDNETGKEITGFMQKYSREEIVILAPIKMDARKVRFKIKDK